MPKTCRFNVAFTRQEGEILSGQRRGPDAGSERARHSRVPHHQEDALAQGRLRGRGVSERHLRGEEEFYRELRSLRLVAAGGLWIQRRLWLSP